MRRSFPVFLTVALWALGAGTVAAQITLVPGPAQPVSQSPKFIAAADFNQDGFADAAVSNVVSAKISVLFGSATGAFSSAVDMSVGRTVRGLVTGDLNQDHIPDIGVADLLTASVFRITSNGNGTFNRPEQFRVGLFPSDLAIGNFDGKNGNDLATANSGQNSTTVLLNLGGTRGFTTLGSYGLGNNPKRIDAADVNGDGLDDILAINTGSAGADDVSVLLNSGVGSFGFPTNFVAGVGSVDMVVSDFNNDGVPDIAVLNAGTVQATPNQFSITILLNRTQVVGGKTVGQGFFDTAPTVTVRCPLTISGLAIGCTPTGITAADFDNDGNIDLAISISTKSLVNSVVTDGLVQAFAGRGDGSFDFATQLNVGAGAAAVVAADFNGDGTQDVAVAEALTKSVRIIRSLAPPPHEPGFQPCNLSTQCTTTFCVDHTCCNSSTCGQGQFCDIPGSLGTCSPPAPNGNPCDDQDGHECRSGHCVITSGETQGFCCSTACAAGQVCNTGVCTSPADVGLGTQCVTGQECNSSFCTNGVCCITDVCPDNEYCDIPGLEGTCNLQQPVGSPCTNGQQCLATTTAPNGACVDDFCCAVAQCPLGQSCGVPGSLGTCVPRPTNTPTPSSTPIPTSTPTPQPNGAVCGNPSQCASGNCTDGVCCNQAPPCPTSPTGLAEFCNITFFPGTCHTKGASGDTCQVSTDCQSGNCASGHCGAAPTATATATATATRTPTPLPAGAQCSSSTAPCQSGLVCGNEGVCCNERACPGGQSCRVAGSEGTCTDLPTPTPTKAGPGITCGGPGDCASNACINNVCCNDANCADPMRCDITGFPGICKAPLALGAVCTKNSDCESPWICNQATGLCDTTQNTPTAIPDPSITSCDPPFQLLNGVCVNTSRSGGGCSIDDRSDGRVAWLLALLPVALLVRRRRWDQARVLSRRDIRHQ